MFKGDLWSDFPSPSRKFFTTAMLDLNNVKHLQLRWI